MRQKRTCIQCIAPLGGEVGRAGSRLKTNEQKTQAKLVLPSWGSADCSHITKKCVK